MRPATPLSGPAGQNESMHVLATLVSSWLHRVWQHTQALYMNPDMKHDPLTSHAGGSSLLMTFQLQSSVQKKKLRPKLSVYFPLQSVFFDQAQ